MATTNYSWITPIIGADTDTWGTKLNDALEAIDGQLFIVDTSDQTKMPLSGGTFTGGVTGTTGSFSSTVTANLFNGTLSGNAATATTAAGLTTSRTFSLIGDVTAPPVGFDGTGNVELTTTYAPADGALTIAKTSGLQAALDAKEPTLNADQKLKITYGTAAASGTPADGDIYLQHEA